MAGNASHSRTTSPVVKPSAQAQGNGSRQYTDSGTGTPSTKPTQSTSSTTPSSRPGYQGQTATAGYTRDNNPTTRTTPSSRPGYQGQTATAGYTKDNNPTTRTTPPTNAKQAADPKPAGATDKVLAGGSQYAIVERTLPDGSTQKIRFSANDGPNGTVLSSTPPTLPKTNAPTAAPTGQTAPITATTPVVGTTPAVTDAPESSGMLISSGGASGGTAIGSTAPSAPTDTTTRPPVAPTTPAQPGSSSASDLIVYSIDELQANTKMLRETAESVIAVWNDIINTQIGELEKSWAGPDASVYTEKVKAFDPKIKAACQAIELLADTFDKSGNEISETQNQNVNDIELI